ncbi:hypothetical protein [Sphingobacterium kitahiroshimense]|uniref:Fibrobacter succinogenes major paralogous domain-containing protein n=1 Tax=Sphingobacterium kitahiroshimense TaxID=470446 RepID=A0ABV0BP61_9SPHI
MKSITHNKKLIYLLCLISLLFTTVLFNSCERTEEKDISQSSNVSISVSQIKAPVVLVSDIGNMQSTKALKGETSGVSTKTFLNEVNFSDFSWSTSPDVNSTIKNNSMSNKRSAVSTTNVTAMGFGKKYRVLFYEVKDGSEIYRESAEITVASSKYTLDLKSNVTYRWYAYSYNDDKPIPMPKDLSNPVIETRTDAPFLYDEGKITTNSLSGSIIDVQFEHKISKIELKVDASPIFANSFNSLKANFVKLPLTTQGFGLKTGSLATQMLTTSESNSVITFKDEASPSTKISTNELYTTSPITNIQVSFTEIAINKSGNRIDLIKSSNPRLALIQGFSASSESLKRGLVTLKYKGTVIGNTEWAYGILYYDPTDNINQYKISEPYLVGTTHECNYYWNWNSLYPRSMTNDETVTFGDPCKEVLPKNTWRTPTTADFRNLNVAIPNSPENGAVYFTGSSNTGERVYFHEAGWITDNDCDVSNTNDGMYWASDSYSSTRGVTLEVDERGGTGAGNRVTDYPKDRGMTIKCVKKP